MNEIDKLKIEHERYEKALMKIHDQYNDSSDAFRHADAALNPPSPAPVTLEALNPPSPAPVTLEALMAAMHARNCRTGELLHITFFSDGSGRIGSYDRAYLFSFDSLQEALNHFTSDGN